MVGDRNVFREFCTINRGTVGGRGVTTIADDCLFMAYSHVAHDCIVGSHCIMSNCTALAGHVELGDWVILSGYSGIHQFCKVGAHAFLANNAAVTRDVPPYLLVAGSPAEPKGVNSEGLKRRGFNAGADREHQERIPACSTAPGSSSPRPRSSCARSCRRSRSSRLSSISSPPANAASSADDRGPAGLRSASSPASPRATTWAPR